MAQVDFATAFTARLAWLMQNGPRGPMRQVDIVQRSADMGQPLTKAEVNRIVHGNTDPKLSTLAKLADALSVQLVDLMPQRPGMLERLAFMGRSPLYGRKRARGLPIARRAASA